MKSPSTPHPAMRLVAGVLLALGVLVILASLFADLLDLGGGEGFGWKQLIGLVVGLVLALLGGAWLIQPPTSRGLDTSLE